LLFYPYFFSTLQVNSEVDYFEFLELVRHGFRLMSESFKILISYGRVIFGSFGYGGFDLSSQ